MSCEVIAIPYGIAWVIGTVAATAANSIADSLAKVNSEKTNQCEDVKIITTEHFLEKDFETPFIDKNILFKTLEEHGARGINQSDLEVTCVIDKYNLTFKRDSVDKPFTLRLSGPKTSNAEEKVDDISSWGY